MPSFKTTETLLGIETRLLAGGFYSCLWCFKTTETLLGIETCEIAWRVGFFVIGLQNHWNPFRDWNQFGLRSATLSRNGGLQNHWNPFRDWNMSEAANSLRVTRFKTTETLLGIETWGSETGYHRSNSFKTTETLLGIETFVWQTVGRSECFKTTETLLGIETYSTYYNY